MKSYAPDNYVCPLCLVIDGIENEQTMMRQDDIVFRDGSVVCAINSKFVGNNPGHVIVFPVDHYETIWDLPAEVGSQIMEVSQYVAHGLLAVRACDGVMVQQNNGPASGQHAFHYHMHLFPRFDGDDFTAKQHNVRVSEPEERLVYSQPLRVYLAERL